MGGRATQTTLILIGVACIVGAIVGGGVKLVQVELRAFDSLQRQILLGVFGIILVAAGLIMGNGTAPSKLATDSSAPTTTSETSAEVKDTTPPVAAAPSLQGQPVPRPQTPVAPTADASSAPAATAPPVHTATAALPNKVDIFWCEAADGSEDNREAGSRVGAALQADGRVARVRVRPLSLATNARPDYSIASDIVRFDPGERGEATLLASLATSASGRNFAAAPALPGTPSVDYLSIFVCAAH